MYLRLHYKHTKETYLQKADSYNRQMKEKHPEEYRKMTLKKTFHDTFYHLLNAYGTHLNNLQAAGQPQDGPFRINNCALATMARCHRKTIYEHIKRFQQAGIITGKVLHGSNSSYELTINPLILIAEPTPELSKWLVKNPHNLVDNPKNLVENSPSVDFSKPSFHAIFNNSVTLCNHIVLQETLKNNNIEAETNSQAKTHSSFSDNLTHIPPLPVGSKKQMDKKQGSINHAGYEQVSSAAKNFVPPKDRYGKEMGWYIERALHFILLSLYNNRSLFENQLSLTIQLIRTFFSNSISYEVRFSEFMQIVSYQAHSNSKRLDWDHPDPWIWLDPNKKGNIYSTEKFYREKIIPYRKIKKDYHIDKRIFSEAIVLYYHNPGIASYMKGKQMIGKRMKGELLNQYNKCVLDKKHYTKEVYNVIKLQQDFSYAAA